MLPIIIFDFDGTIADTFELWVKEYNAVAPLFRCKKILPSELPRLRNERPFFLLAHAHVWPWKLPLIVPLMRRRFQRHTHTVRLFTGIPELLRDLRRQGFHLIILTSSSKTATKRILKQHQLLSLFSSIFVSSGIFGKAKVLKKIQKKERRAPHELISIGDEVRDIEAGQKAGVRSIAVSWGFQGEHILCFHKPDALVNSPNELRDAIKTLADAPQDQAQSLPHP
jgi:phosphoglycolate phosphatase-like HAD superfamily hydrolase